MSAREIDEAGDTPTRFVAVDWSGASQGSERKIVTAIASAAGELMDVVTGRTREQTVRAVVELARQGPLVVGLDFAFSFPAAFLDRNGLEDGPAAWRWARDRGEDVLRRCPTPFWGRPGTRKPALSEEQQFRRTEREAPRIGGTVPKSVLQIGGAGAVGTGSLRGMPFLLELQRHGFSIWPFDDPVRGRSVVLEIYPRVFTGPVVKSDRAARAAFLSRAALSMREEHRKLATDSEDAFDATVSALALAHNAGELQNLRAPRDPVLRREGALWTPSDSEAAPRRRP